MICRNCNKEIREEFAFCPHCSAATGEDEDTPKAPRKGRRALIIGIIATAVLIILSLVGWFLMRHFVFGVKDYQSVAMTYAAAEMTVDVEKMNDNAVFRFDRVLETYLDSIGEITGGLITKEKILDKLDINENMLGVGSEFLLKYISREADKTLTEKYGEYTVTTERISSKKLTGEEIIESIEQSKKEAKLLNKLLGSDVNIFEEFSDSGISEKDLESGGYLVEVSVTVSGEYDSDTDTKSYIVVERNGEWKVLNMNVFTYNMDW